MACNATTQNDHGSCSPQLGYQLLLVVDSPDHGASESESLDEWLTVQVTDGPVGLAGGFFVPCLSGEVFLVPPYLARGFAALDGVWTTSRTCGTGAFNPANAIAFTFDEPQTLELILDVSVNIGRNGGLLTAFASFDGFELYDTAGQRIAADVTVSTPEASTLTLLGGGLLLIGLCAMGRPKTEARRSSRRESVIQN